LIDDVEIKDSSSVERVVLCSGKVFYDLMEARRKSDETRVSIVRLEQFYPFPMQRLREVIAGYPSTKQLVWVQEEPKNMGGWTFVEPLLERLVPACDRSIYIGRPASASPATGSYAVHQFEQASLVQEALTLE
jgi:2-oxoglutarate dehydrogenase E1 component